jgi:hypothetical protein
MVFAEGKNAHERKAELRYRKSKAAQTARGFVLTEARLYGNRIIEKERYSDQSRALFTFPFSPFPKNTRQNG